MRTSPPEARVVQVQTLFDRPLIESVGGAGWDALAGRTAPIGTTAWVRAWLDVHGADHRVRVLTAEQDDSLCAVLPLVQHRPGSAWEMLGVRQLHEPTDVLGSDPDAVRRLAEELAGQRVPLRLRRLPVDSPLLPELRRAWGRRAVISSTPANGTPTLALDPSWTSPEQHFNSGRRGDFRTARRRADRLGEVITEVLMPAPAEVDALLDELITVESAGWKRAAGTALAVQAGQQAFFRALCRYTSEEGTLRLAFLRIDGRAVAVQLAVEQAGRYSLLKIGYDEEFRRISPGNLLMLETVRWCAERGIAHYDFLGEEEPWTAMWSSSVRGCVDVRVDPVTPRGAAAATWDGVSWGVRAGRSAPRRVMGKLRSRGGLRALRPHMPEPLLARAAAAYLTGRARGPAKEVADRVAATGRRVSLGYWYGDGDTPQTVADECLAGIDEVQGLAGAAFAVKAPGLRFDEQRVRGLARHATAAEVALVFDAHSPDDAAATLRLATVARDEGASVGVAISSRWRRSAEDARRAVEQGLAVRVVKGQWSEPDDPLTVTREPALRRAFLSVVDAVAGATVPVSVATHDASLLDAALSRLQAAGTPCEAEFLLGLPARRCLAVAARHGVPVRWYLPYGHPSLAYPLASVLRRPRLAVALGEGVALGRWNQPLRLRQALS